MTTAEYAENLSAAELADVDDELLAIEAEQQRAELDAEMAIERFYETGGYEDYEPSPYYGDYSEW